MVLKKIYDSIKREHLFVILVILTALVLFNYFNFEYTGSVVQEKSCYQNGYSCCSSGDGLGNYYFSLDNSCSDNYECWDSCQDTVITAKATLIDSLSGFFDNVKKSVNDLLGKRDVGKTILPDEDSEFEARGGGGGQTSPCQLKKDLPYQMVSQTFCIDEEFGTFGADDTNVCASGENKPYLVCRVFAEENRGECGILADSCSGFLTKESCESTYPEICEWEGVCGDNVLDVGEECDDGNTANDDSCSSACTEITTTIPIDPTPSCGDGEVNQEIEDCDDGNTGNGDGCSSTCKNEILEAPDLKDLIVKDNGILLTWDTQGGDYVIEGNVINDRIANAVVRDNLVSGEAIKDDIKNIYDNVVDFFKKLFKPRTVGVDLSNINGFRIYRSIDASTFSDTPTYTLDLEGTECNDQGICTFLDSQNLQSGTTYYYKIIMYDLNNVNGELSEVKSITFSTIGPIRCIECAAPGFGCSYVNGSCTSCGTRVCTSIPILVTSCNSGDIKSGTQCFVCNSEGDNYTQDNSKCLTGQTCNADGQCITTLVEDTTPPIVTITNPNADTTTSNSSFTVSGTASDNIQVSKVQIKLNDGNWEDTTGTTSWSKTLTLISGQNTIRVNGTDTSSLISNGQSRIITYNAPTTIKGEDDYENGCNNNIDDDSDLIWDGLDNDCATGEKVTISSITVPDNKPYEDSEFEIQCKIGILPATGGTATLNRAQPCIIASISNKLGTQSQNCVFLKRTDDTIRYKCSSGNVEKDKVASCKVDTIKCNGDLATLSNNVAQMFINVTTPSLCTNIIGQERLVITDVDLNDKEYKLNEKINPVLTLENLDNENLDIVSESYLYDLNSKKQLSKVSQNKLIAQGLNEEEMKFELITPSVSASKFKLYFKTYLKNQENEICLINSQDVNIKASVGNASGCQDLDRDGYSDRICGGNDCNDNNPNIKPGVVEICTDGLDNDCNGFADSLDQSCVSSACNSGDTRECGLNVGACRKGTQTCSGSVWGTCIGETKPNKEVCGDGLDNDCNGLTDCSDAECSEYPNCAVGGEDRDSDGLLDSWELEYFGSLEVQSGEDDFDGDGYTNAQEYANNTNPTLEDKKTSVITIIIIVVAVLGIAGFLIWMFAIKPKKPMGLGFKPSTTVKSITKISVNSKLVDYVKNSLKKGYSRQQISNALKIKGWSEREIEEAFRQAK